ncbi:unnamed protein product [Allacma fusca]|uniref:Uncharacterized protein n=1 Tax=Allacma fusca TaxID=39272 RepID=A0A8J2KLD6_9HEXA|nr:unnamed protein product [Allacma fusca]
MPPKDPKEREREENEGEEDAFQYYDDDTSSEYSQSSQHFVQQDDEFPEKQAELQFESPGTDYIPIGQQQAGANDNTLVNAGLSQANLEQFNAQQAQQAQQHVAMEGIETTPETVQKMVDIPGGQQMMNISTTRFNQACDELNQTIQQHAPETKQMQPFGNNQVAKHQGLPPTIDKPAFTIVRDGKTEYTGHSPKTPEKMEEGVETTVLPGTVPFSEYPSTSNPGTPQAPINTTQGSTGPSPNKSQNAANFLTSTPKPQRQQGEANSNKDSANATINHEDADMPES